MVKHIWHTISEFSVCEKHSDDANIIRFFNQMITVSTIASFIILVCSLLFSLPLIYSLIALSSTLVHSFGLALNYFNKFHIVRFMLPILCTSWITAAHMFIGGHFSQSAPIVACVVIAVVAFNYQVKKYLPVVFIVISMYAGSMLYVQYNGTIFEELNQPFDELLILITCLIWTVGLIFLFKKEKEELIEDLSTKNIALEEATENLELFTYAASHDLKSPINSMTSFLNLIEKDAQKGNIDGIIHKLTYAKSSAKQMSFLLEGIMELSKIRDLKNANHSHIDLNEILQQTKLNLMHYVEENNAVIEVEGSFPQFYGTATEFAMLFQNFIQNGIKYNKSTSPKVIVSSHISTHHLTIQFKDNGIGIDQKNYQKIFQFFQRLHSNSEFQGSGLGLGMCKKIIDAYEGYIEIDSEVGVGTTFKIHLPIKEKIIPVTETKLEHALSD